MLETYTHTTVIAEALRPYVGVYHTGGSISATERGCAQTKRFGSMIRPPESFAHCIINSV